MKQLKETREYTPMRSNSLGCVCGWGVRSVFGVQLVTKNQTLLLVKPAQKFRSCCDYDVLTRSEGQSQAAIMVPHMETTLEWILPSPPPLHCFEEPPMMVLCTDDKDCAWVNPGFAH